MVAQKQGSQGNFQIGGGLARQVRSKAKASEYRKKISLCFSGQLLGGGLSFVDLIALKAFDS
jgi:hypothetical protein